MQRLPDQRHETLRTNYHGYHQQVLPTFSRFSKVRRGAGENIVTPSNWLFQSSMILSALHALVTGVLLTSVCNRFKSQRAAESYVDDTD
eukprot:11711599-Ditylum_brightwellii.AAC.1